MALHGQRRRDAKFTMAGSLGRLYKSAASSTIEEADMNDLHTWLSQQHHGLRTFHSFQQKLAILSRDEPGQRALCRLLSSLVGGYIEAFDEEPLPVAVAVADRAYRRLLDLVANLDCRAGADHRLADLNRVAACDLWH
jgi:hypothetical protein